MLPAPPRPVEKRAVECGVVVCVVECVLLGSVVLVLVVVVGRAKGRVRGVVRLEGGRRGRMLPAPPMPVCV